MNNDINEKIVHAAPVPPFVRFVASAVPMVFDNSLSYYECLCALWKWMQDNLVDVINNNATVTEHYIDLDLETRALFNQLKTYVDTYFDNLDVQDEINNKLDAMAEAGTLQEIITAYIQSNVAWTFDTVADMKQATNLVDGSYARTLGFHSVNDGGGALYHITNSGTANEMDVIAVDTLFAHLIKPAVVTPEMYGAYGDGIHDDTASIQECFTKNDSVQMSKTYLITSQLTYNGSIDGKGTGIIKTNSASRISGAFIVSSDYLNIRGIYFDCTSNVTFTLDDKFEEYNDAIIAHGKLEVSSCEFHNLYEKFIRISDNTVSYVNIHDNLFSSDNKTNVYMATCLSIANIDNDDTIINVHDNTMIGYEYEYVDTYDNDYNVNAAGIVLSNVNVKDITIDSNTLSHLGRHGSVSGNEGLSRLEVVDCYFNVTPLKLTNNKIIDCH